MTWAILAMMVVPLWLCACARATRGRSARPWGLSVFDVTKQAIVVRQAHVLDQLPPFAGEERVEYTPVQSPPLQWWAGALIPLDGAEPVAATLTAAGS